MNIRTKFFGRLSRSSFLLGIGLSFILFLEGLGWTSPFAASPKPGIYFLILILIFTIGVFILFVARLHDMGYSGWWALVVFMVIFISFFISVPAISISLLILAVIPGEKVSNKYGDAPQTLLGLYKIWSQRK